MERKGTQILARQNIKTRLGWVKQVVVSCIFLHFDVLDFDLRTLSKNITVSSSLNGISFLIIKNVFGVSLFKRFLI